MAEVTEEYVSHLAMPVSGEQSAAYHIALVSFWGEYTFFEIGRVWAVE